MLQDMDISPKIRKIQPVFNRPSRKRGGNRKNRINQTKGTLITKRLPGIVKLWMAMAVSQSRSTMPAASLHQKNTSSSQVMLLRSWREVLASVILTRVPSEAMTIKEL